MNIARTHPTGNSSVHLAGYLDLIAACSEKNPTIIKTSLTTSKILEGFFESETFLRNGRRPTNSLFASRYQQTALMMMMQEREQEGHSAGVNYLMVGWSWARSKLVGEEGEVQQGDLKQ